MSEGVPDVRNVTDAIIGDAMRRPDIAGWLRARKNRDAVNFIVGNVVRAFGPSAPSPVRGSRKGRQPPEPVTFNVNGVSFTMVPIPERNYSMGEMPVTQALWEAVMGSNPSHFRGASRPVEQVDWFEASKSCRLLSELTGRPFRLPTEAEWTHACRAGTKTEYFWAGPGKAHSWGGDPEHAEGYAWFWGNADRQTHPVGQKHPNRWGLYDMVGNVWEWCSDAVDGLRVARGGSWVSLARHLRVECQTDRPPIYRHSDLGFRLVMDGARAG